MEHQTLKDKLKSLMETSQKAELDLSSANVKVEELSSKLASMQIKLEAVEADLLTANAARVINIF